ncbi:unnamed protein product [Chrysodeixis includens]|uniref:MADF domain-containing protein n=1 Tax=Chrysodeixis includens TaxID=689277 RepID=A0A9P0BKR0_CHRIL|nr:unnamed protein product [Chrysodeixis includens]
MSKKVGPEENFWLPFQLDIIKRVKRHPIIYIRDIMMTPNQYRAAVSTAWDRIAREVRVPPKICKQEWWTIKLRYAKLNNMIRYRKVSEEVIKQHPKTSKYLDGCLEFMDGYIYEITDDQIPPCIHKRFNRMFGVTSKEVVTKEMVQALLKNRMQAEESKDELGKIHVQNLMNIVENAVERSLREMSLADKSNVPETPESRASVRAMESRP